MLIFSRNAENLVRNRLETMQILPKVTHEAHNPTNISKAIPKTAKVHQKSAKGDPKATKRLQKGYGKVTKKHPKRHPETTPKPNPEPETSFPPKCL